MDLIHEKVFVNRYHYDVRNHEWEKENGVPKTNVEVTFQLHNKDEEANNTSVVAVLQFMILLDTITLYYSINMLYYGNIIDRKMSI